MLINQMVDTGKVLVELSIVPIGGNGQVCDQVDKVLNLFDGIELTHQRTNYGTWIEGDWKDISKLIYSCYERVQEEFPQGFLKVSIR
jgi:uncharacterized protein YqgV (UPF0045/DUF77 family)